MEVLERPLGLRALPKLHCREYYLLRGRTWINIFIISTLESCFQSRFSFTTPPPKRSSWFELYCLIRIVRKLNKIFHNILNVDSLLSGSKQCNNRQRGVTFQCIENNLLSYVYKRKSHSSVFVLIKSFWF